MIPLTMQQNPLLQNDPSKPNQNLVDALMSKAPPLVPPSPDQLLGANQDKQNWLYKVPGLNGAIPGIGPLDLLGFK